MSANREGLTAEDIRILEIYAEANNRELYFNYLAQKQGNDGYGLLALGVVRNDNAPGATANRFADRQADADGKRMSEGDWQAFGVELMQRDLALRKVHFGKNAPELALNLPVEDIQEAHDEAFKARGIHPSAWTPYKLLEAARAYGGREEAEAVWAMLLDNKRLGLDRMEATSNLVLGKYRELIDDPVGYLQHMAEARLPQGKQPVSNLDPDRIAYRGQTYVHDGDTGQWRREITATVNAPVIPVPLVRFPVGSDKVNDPQTVQYLDDARQVRQLREALRGQFHPEDPNRDRPIIASPWLLADTAPEQGDENAAPRMAHGGDPRHPEHPRHALYQQCRVAVCEVDAGLGKLEDMQSERLTASATLLAAGACLQRVDHVLIGRTGVCGQHGPNVFVVQGERDDPTHLRAQMPLAQAVATAVEQSFQQLAVNDQRQTQEQALQREREPSMAQASSGPVLG